jgi:hypothetical protein
MTSVIFISTAEAAEPLATEVEAASVRGVGDVDGDGYGDVVATDGDGSDAALRRGSPTGPLPVAATLPGPACGPAPEAGPAGDADADGLADFWLSWPASPCGPARVELWRGREGVSGVSPAYAELAAAWSDPISATASSAGDTDGDGHSDLVLVRGGQAEWRPRGGEARWTAPADGAAGVGDTNGDGYADLLLTDGDLARWYPGGPSGPGPSSWQAPGLAGMRVLGLGDVDGDGFDDFGVVVAAGRGFPGSLTVFGGGPSGPEAQPSGVTAGGALSRITGAVALGDVDGDGLAEVTTTGPDDPEQVWALGDVDGDGLTDFAAGEGSGVTYFGAAADADGDAIGRWADCDDADDRIGGGAEELAGDGVDQDCDGGDLCLADADGDGFGGAATLASADLDCVDPGEAPLADDCDDADPRRGGPEEPADGRDGDCDGRERCWLDLDQDGFGGRLSRSADKDCADWGEAARAGDCDDHDEAVFPGAPGCESPLVPAQGGCAGGGAVEWGLLLAASVFQRARKLLSAA